MATKTSTQTDNYYRVRNPNNGTIHAEIPGSGYRSVCGQNVMWKFDAVEDDVPVTCKVCLQHM
jgi:hypothetical protein